MYPEDRVLVGVINRRRDLRLAQEQGWYRIPRARAPRSIDAEYIAFYLSRAFEDKNGGIHYYARRTGHELALRRDLLPDEVDHSRAENIYYKMQLGPLIAKQPPILNPLRRPISFIYTTWDRFAAAATIADLYSKADWYVERVYHALRQVGIAPERKWEDEDPASHLAELRVRCEKGILAAIAHDQDAAEPDAYSPDSSVNVIKLPLENVEKGVETIQKAIEALGGLKFVPLSLD